MTNERIFFKITGMIKILPDLICVVMDTVDLIYEF